MGPLNIQLVEIKRWSDVLSNDDEPYLRAYSAQFSHPFRSIPARYSGDSGRGRSEATLEVFS
jgi:hypothetical protein